MEQIFLRKKINNILNSKTYFNLNELTFPFREVGFLSKRNPNMAKKRGR